MLIASSGARSSAQFSFFFFHLLFLNENLQANGAKQHLFIGSPSAASYPGLIVVFPRTNLTHLNTINQAETSNKASAFMRFWWIQHGARLGMTELCRDCGSAVVLLGQGTFSDVLAKISPIIIIIVSGYSCRISCLLRIWFLLQICPLSLQMGQCTSSKSKSSTSSSSF